MAMLSVGADKALKRTFFGQRRRRVATAASVGASGGEDGYGGGGLVVEVRLTVGVGVKAGVAEWAVAVETVEEGTRGVPANRRRRTPRREVQVISGQARKTQKAPVSNNDKPSVIPRSPFWSTLGLK